MGPFSQRRKERNGPGKRTRTVVVIFGSDTGNDDDEELQLSSLHKKEIQIKRSGAEGRESGVRDFLLAAT